MSHDVRGACGYLSRREIIWHDDQKTLAQCSLLPEVESESAGDAVW